MVSGFIFLCHRNSATSGGHPKADAPMFNLKNKCRMEKSTYRNVTVECVTQNEKPSVGSTLTGVLAMNNAGFRFEEAVAGTRHSRNLKLFEGDYVSLVHKQNGRYQCHLRTIDASGSFDRQNVAYKVYCELMSAFTHIQ